MVETEIQGRAEGDLVNSVETQARVSGSLDVQLGRGGYISHETNSRRTEVRGPSYPLWRCNRRFRPAHILCMAPILYMLFGLDIGLLLGNWQTARSEGLQSPSGPRGPYSSPA